MFEKIRPAFYDQNGDRRPLKATLIIGSIAALLVMLALWVVAIALTVYPQPFLAAAIFAAGIWYGSRFGFALPSGPRREPGEASEAGTRLAARKAASFMRTAKRDRQIGRGE